MPGSYVRGYPALAATQQYLLYIIVGGVFREKIFLNLIKSFCLVHTILKSIFNLGYGKPFIKSHYREIPNAHQIPIFRERATPPLGEDTRRENTCTSLHIADRRSRTEDIYLYL